MVHLPLAGITVVSLEQAVAAPFATRQLADLGARVIKIEKARGDFARAYDDTVGGESSFFVWLNRTKESVVLDLNDSGDRELIDRLVAQADVFVSNLRPGVLERFSLAAADVHATNPRLIHCVISGYGTGGSYTMRKAYDLIIQCEAGMLSLTGTPYSPSKVGPSIADIAAGMYAYSGILAALIGRANTGVGQALEISMLEALGEWMSQPHLYATQSGVAPKRWGSSHATIVPYGAFPTRDASVFMGIQNDAEWQSLCEDVLERPELAADARLATNAQRRHHREEITDSVAQVTRGMAAGDLVARLDGAGIANARMRDMFEFDAHPQLAERSRWRDVVTPSGHIARTLIPPTARSGDEVSWGSVPAVGEHTDAVREEFSGRRP